MGDRTLAVGAGLECLPVVARWLQEASRAESLPYDVAFGLDLAGHEAVENVVRHGRAFDPMSVPPPPVPQRLEDVIPGGQGIHLIRYFTDEIRYSREGERNVLVLARRLVSEAG